MSKTYKKGSRHNVYPEDWIELNVRVKQELRRKVEIAAEKKGCSIASFIREVLNESVKDVALTVADQEMISERVEIKRLRNRKRIGLA